MFDAHFGFTAPPFQLIPDASFYFESQGHGRAMRYLRYGIYQGEGFVVVTGEVGSGKTTLVRALLEGLDAGKVAAAQIVNTQLDAHDLLRSICNAFGTRPAGDSKARLLESLEAHFRSLAARNCRPLLIVDEAQNLTHEALEELRMLSNYQLGNRALLQSFLVGQPELRRKLTSADAEQIRQRVLASCHLGPLTARETAAYVEHRLRRVGWNDSPSFEDGAFATLHAESRGIPRLINALCTRSLLAAWVCGGDVISTDGVLDAAAELREEQGMGGSVRPTKM